MLRAGLAGCKVGLSLQLVPFRGYWGNVVKMQASIMRSQSHKMVVTLSPVAEGLGNSPETPFPHLSLPTGIRQPQGVASEHAQAAGAVRLSGQHREGRWDVVLPPCRWETTKPLFFQLSTCLHFIPKEQLQSRAMLF